MTNENPSFLEQAPWIEPLKQIETITRSLRKPAEPSDAGTDREEAERELTKLSSYLPAEARSAVRGRFNCGKPISAPMRRGTCTSCFLSVPKGDQFLAVKGEHPVFCQYCGILLYADTAELQEVASRRR